MLNQLYIAGAELSLLACVCITLLYGVFTKAHTRNLVIGFVFFFFVISAAYFLVKLEPGRAFSEMLGSALVMDETARFAKLSVLALFVPFYLVMTRRMFYDLSLRDRGLEYSVVSLLALIGMFVMISAQNLIAFYLGLELQSLALYILVAFVRDHEKSSEAALKYLTLGAISSGLFLYGASLLYGVFGSLDYSVIAEGVSQSGSVNSLVIVGAILVICVFLFKLSVAPFHAWAPDVYQGSGLYTVMFIAGAPKIAAAFSLAVLLTGPFYGLKEALSLSLSAAVCLTLILGAVSAIRQTNLSRMIAFSAVTHSGYMMLAILSSQEKPDLIILEYAFVYAFTVIGLFTILEGFALAGKKIETIQDLNGLSQTHSKAALLITIFLLALAGLPPFAGFIVKFKTLSFALSAGYFIPVIVAVLASAVSLFYYLRAVRSVYFEAPNSDSTETKTIEISSFYYIVSGFFAIAVSLYILFPQFYIQTARLFLTSGS